MNILTSRITPVWLGATMFLLAVMVLRQSCSAETNYLMSAILSFPEISADLYRGDVATTSANILIEAGQENACAALDSVIEMNQNAISNKEFDAYDALNRKLCHLVRLIFTSRDSAHPLRPPKLGMLQFMPVLSMRQEEWPDLPYVVTNDIALSLNLGYAGSGLPESAQKYLGYCKSNGIFRAKLLNKPTSQTASNALNQVFTSPAWKALKWKDKEFDFTYDLDEKEVKRMLWQQVVNLK